MTSALPQPSTLTIRPFQHRDLDAVASLAASETAVDSSGKDAAELGRKMQTVRHWYGLLKCLSFFPNPLRYFFCTYVAEQISRVCGMIQVAPFNKTRSTWSVKRVTVDTGALSSGTQCLSSDIGSQLLRHCFQAIWEARTWLIEVNVNDNFTLALYRQNGFQTLAHITSWAIAPETLQALAEREPDLPNLLPVSNADAVLLHQLDTVSMPPLIRQVFDRHVIDFKISLVGSIVKSVSRWLSKTDSISGYVFEPQRKAAIGYFDLKVCRDGSCAHKADLTVHPAYTWLYPELLAQMARLVKDLPPQPLHLTSTDYQQEREEFLEQLGATRIEHTLMMSRSVWHKLRESRFVALEGLQLSEVLQGLQPSRKPVPGRFSFVDSVPQEPITSAPSASPSGDRKLEKMPLLSELDSSEKTPD
ncbi:MAG: GNAT family N-acetyltransferase [Oscillatoriophycideae cyanobacterium NC_groundwater_1537_Pr4_S-0.65um_50_18]|nr:GNAT family N-acetyltransferase [Oscillatoriophycideae cyanobacterium NC_groundwater_1537_Pr4_S-0.65um_50_18]